MQTANPQRDAPARTRILEAAAQVAADSGAGHLTIEAVAAEAKLSKGGVLYHFPNKRSLLLGMLDHLIDTTQARVAAFASELGETPGASLQAHIKAQSTVSVAERAMSMSLLAAAAEDPELMAPARASLAEAFGAIADDAADRDLANVLLLASEGLRFLEMLNLSPFGKRELQQVHACMLRLAAGAPPV